MLENLQRIEEIEEKDEIEKENKNSLKFIKTNVNFAISKIQNFGTNVFPLFLCNEEDYILGGFNIEIDVMMYLNSNIVSSSSSSCLLMYWSVMKLKKNFLEKGINFSSLINTNHGEQPHSPEILKNTIASGFECLKLGKPVKIKLKKKMEKQFIPTDDVIAFVLKPSIPYSEKRDSILQDFSSAVLNVVGYVWNCPIKINI